jgi:hypothetical protein
VVHVSATLSENLVFFGEASVTAQSSGLALATERLILPYEFNDPLKVSAGRYDTPISYWNTAFHHGLWLQGSTGKSVGAPADLVGECRTAVASSGLAALPLPGAFRCPSSQLCFCSYRP